jgi:hypothetical protein
VKQNKYSTISEPRFQNLREIFFLKKTATSECNFQNGVLGEF